MASTKFMTVVVTILILCLSSGGFLAANDDYGAIAYCSERGACGWAVGYSSRAEAERASVSSCGYSCCEPIVWFRNSCGALAKGVEGALGRSWGAQSRDEAERIALSMCGEGGIDCKIICWACASR